MDVLQLLKTELKERLAELTLLAEGSETQGLRIGILGRLKAYLNLEVSYLLPELIELSPKNEALFARISNELQEMLEQVALLDANNSLDNARVQALRSSFMAHMQSIEDRILPLMRQRITTAEREELFHVLEDAKQDLMKAAALELAI